MKEFKFAQPQSLDQVTSLLSQEKVGYSLMAGGTDLLDEIKNKIIAPEVVIDLQSIPDLSAIKMDKNHVSIGAMTSVADLAENPIIKESFPGLVEAALSLASPQLRNVGTVGGNLCQRPRCWYYRDPDTNCAKCSAPMFMLHLPKGSYVEACQRAGCVHHKMRIVTGEQLMQRLFDDVGMDAFL